MIKQLHFFPGCLLVFMATACTPTVRLSTTDPVKIDVNIRTDVYTHSDKDKKDESSANQEGQTPDQRRFNRRGEVQALKNGRAIGESREGLLVLYRKPEDASYATYAARVVSEENNDRREIFKQRATELKKPLDVFIREFATNTRNASFPGEWVQDESGEWKQR